MKTKILLNGVGRIGKAILKIILENKNFEIIYKTKKVLASIVICCFLYK